MRGSTGTAPLKVLDEKALVEGGKRWRFASLKTRLQTTSARPAALPSIHSHSQLQQTHNQDTTVSHFSAVLSSEADANITASFKQFHSLVYPLSLSLPLLFRNRKKLINICLNALQQATQHHAEATVSVARCLTAIFVDIGPNFVHPLFPRIVTSFASVLDATTVASHHNAQHNKSSSAPTILWDPTTSLVPLFASLAEITRVAIHVLAAHPHQTVNSLLPLLSHPHYRIREMTAESCLGYLIRKTRDEQRLNQLTQTVLLAAACSHIPPQAQQHATHGLGVSLFEAMRAPSCRLHSRSLAVMTQVLQTLCLKHKAPENNHHHLEPYMMVAYTCCSNLSRYISNEKDAQSLSAIFVTCGESILSESSNNDNAVANMLYLLRKWIQYGGKRLCDLLGLPYLQRILNFLFKCVVECNADPRICYESLCAMCTVSSYVPLAFSHKTCRHVISPALCKVSESTTSDAMKAVLCVVLEKHKDHWDFARLGALAKGIGTLCDGIASQVDRELPASEDMVRAKISEKALFAALTFIELRNRSCHRQKVTGSGLQSVQLDSQIKSVLQWYAENDDNWIDGASHNRGNDLLRYVLQYLSSMTMPTSMGFLGTIAAKNGLSLEWKADILRAISYQMLQNVSQVSEHDHVPFALVKDMLSEGKDNMLPPSVLQALDFFFQSSGGKVRLSDIVGDSVSEDLESELMEGLSSSDCAVRIASASNLASLSLLRRRRTVEQSNEPDGSNEEEHNADELLQLKRAFDGSDSYAKDLFEVMRNVFETTHSMEKISEKKKHVQQVLRLLQKSKKVSTQLLKSIVHFSIGVLQTPLRLTWKDARSLLTYAVDRDDKLTMSIVVRKLGACRDVLLSRARGQTSEEDEGGKDSDASNRDELHAEYEDEYSANNRPNSSEEKDKNKNSAGGIGLKRASVASSFETSAKRRRTSSKIAFDTVWPWSAPESCDLEKVMKESYIFMPHCLTDDGAMKEKSTTDTPTLVIELIRSLCEVPRHTINYRADIISFYLQLDPQLFSQKLGGAISHGLTNLLEKMGGLKCCESNKNLEDQVRQRLLTDLTAPNSELQGSVLRCLCVSRSAWIKPHRDSLIRLTQSASFREELALITEQLYSAPQELAGSFDEKEAMIDVLTRICFSKLRGKLNKKDSQRSAVLSFMASKLPCDIAFPRLTSLILKPLKHVVNRLDNELSSDISHLKMPDSSVQKAILSSIEAVVKHCRMSLLPALWRKLGIGALVILRNAGKGAQGQSIRSRSLRLCSEMHRSRPTETAILIRGVMEALQKAGFNTEVENTSTRGTPAIMRYVGAVMEANEDAGKEEMIDRHTWAIDYCFAIMKGPDVGVEPVDMSLVVANGFLHFCSKCTLSDSSSPLLGSSASTLLERLGSSLQSLVSLLLSRAEQGRKTQKHWSKTYAASLSALEQLSSISVVDLNVMVPVAEALSASLISGDAFPMSSSVPLKALSAITSRAKKNPGTAQRAILDSVLRLIPIAAEPRFTNDPRAYAALCDLLSNSALPDVEAASHMLKKMNAMQSSKLEAPDLDKQIQALNELTRVTKRALVDSKADIKIAQTPTKQHNLISDEYAESQNVSCSSNALIALFSGACAAVRSEDTAVRGNGGYAIMLMAQWAGLSEHESAFALRHHVFKYLVQATIASRDQTFRREYCRALGELLRRTERLESSDDWDGYTTFPILKSLTSTEDVNTDFFENLVHLQAHRRGKALRDLEKSLQATEPNNPGNGRGINSTYQAFATVFCLPLGMNLAMESMRNPDILTHRRFGKAFQAKEDAKRDVAVWAVSLVGESARYLPWEEYKKCLSSALRRLNAESSEHASSVLYKLLVKISDAYPRREEGSSDYERVSKYLVEFVLPRMLKHVTSGAVEGNVLQVSDTQNSMRNKSVPNAFQAPVAIAIAQLMTRLPSGMLDTNISLLITPMTNALRSRMTGIRDSAKKTLTSVVLILGPKYLGYILKQVLSGLTEGFRRDSCIYVVQSLLNGVFDAEESDTASFLLDDIYVFVSAFLIEELKTGINDERKEYENPNASTSRLRQASVRAAKAGECAEVIATHLSFKEHAERFCLPFLEIHAGASSKLLNRMQDFWRHVVQGFSRNKTMNIQDAFILCYKIVSRSTGAADDLDDIVHTDVQGETSEIRMPSRSDNYRTTKVGLQFLQSILTKNWSLISGTSDESRRLHAMCEPFCEITVSAMKHGRDDLTIVAFRVAQRLLKLPLAGRPEMGNRLSETIVDVISHGSKAISSTGAPETEDSLFITCLRAAAILLSELGNQSFNVVPRDRVEALISVSCECIESGGPEVRMAALSVLRSLVVGEVIVPALYDAIAKVNHMAIHCQSKQLRDACTALSVTFLVSFPLGSKRVRQQLEFFVRNLSYKLAAGRIGALNAIDMVVNKFPVSVLEKECEYLFVALASMVSRDPDPQCRSEASRCLRHLFEKLPAGRKVADLLRMAVALCGLALSDGPTTELHLMAEHIDPIIQRSGASSMTAACMSGKLSDDQITIVVRTAATLLPSLALVKGWETAHAFLACLEEAFERSALSGKKQLEMQQFILPLWKSLPSYLLSKHQWVRLSAARLLGRHLSSAGGRHVDIQHQISAHTIWSSADLVREILRSCTLQLEASILAPELAKQVLENVLCMADVLKRNPRAGDLGTREAEVGTLQTQSNACGEDSDQTEGRALSWLIARMSGIAMNGKLEPCDILRRGCALRFLLVTSKWWDPTVIKRHGRQYTNPVVKVLESGDIRNTSGEAADMSIPSSNPLKNAGPIESTEQESGLTGQGLRLLAQTLQESLIESLGTVEYYEAYNKLRRKREEVKQERKRKAALLAAVDPERAAKKRRKKADGKRQKRKNSERTIPNAVDPVANQRAKLTEGL